MYWHQITHVFICFTDNCIYEGVQYQDGEQIQPNCSTRCTCRQGQFQCEDQPCRNATCGCHGDPHCRSFDSRFFDFQGTCEYVLTQPCNTSEFSVIVRNDQCNTGVSCTEKVTVLVPDDDITIELDRGNGGTVTINGILQPNNGDGIIMQSSRVTVLRSGGHPHVMLSMYGVSIFWNGARRVKVTVSRMWENRLCGLCGNFNYDMNDDFKMPNGSLALTATAFGDSWLYDDSSPDCNNRTVVTDCLRDCRNDIRIAAESRCNIIMNQTIFSSCNAVINPSDYISSCMFDYCCSDDPEGDLCDNVAAYADDCTSRGVPPPNWRRPDFCRKCIITEYILL